jgi:hypothetical protein
MPSTNRFIVYVPRDPNTTGIDARSGIVAPEHLAREAETTGQVTIWYEGNRFAASNLTRYVERVHCAAGRAAHRYPTIARSHVRLALLHPVARFDLTPGVLRVTDVAPLKAWLGAETLQVWHEARIPNRLTQWIGRGRPLPASTMAEVMAFCAEAQACHAHLAVMNGGASAPRSATPAPAPAPADHPTMAALWTMQQAIDALHAQLNTGVEAKHPAVAAHVTKVLERLAAIELSLDDRARRG